MCKRITWDCSCWQLNNSQFHSNTQLGFVSRKLQGKPETWSLHFNWKIEWRTFSSFMTTFCMSGLFSSYFIPFPPFLFFYPSLTDSWQEDRNRKWWPSWSVVWPIHSDVGQEFRKRLMLSQHWLTRFNSITSPLWLVIYLFFSSSLLDVPSFVSTNEQRPIGGPFS